MLCCHFPAYLLDTQLCQSVQRVISLEECNISPRARRYQAGLRPKRSMQHLHKDQTHRNVVSSQQQKTGSQNCHCVAKAWVIVLFSEGSKQIIHSLLTFPSEDCIEEAKAMDGKQPASLLSQDIGFTGKTFEVLQHAWHPRGQWAKIPSCWPPGQWLLRAGCGLWVGVALPGREQGRDQTRAKTSTVEGFKTHDVESPPLYVCRLLTSFHDGAVQNN